MTPIERQFELRKRGITQRAIAKEIGMHEITIGRIMLGQLKSPRGIEFISAKIGCDPQVVFPEYFNQDDNKGRRRKAA